MTPRSRPRLADLPPKLKKKFAELRRKVQGVVAATAVWDSLFTDKERESLGGDAYKAWKAHGHTAGMWSKVREVTPARAVVDIAYEFDWLDTRTRAQLIKAFGEEEPPSVLPRWIKPKGEVLFRGVVVRRIARPLQAKKIVIILDVFEELGWPRQIDDPVTSGPHNAARRRVIESLNKGLTDIHFICVGDGERFGWEERPGKPRKRPVAEKQIVAEKQPVAGKKPPPGA